jgi:putative phage-type endonuclease
MLINQDFTQDRTKYIGGSDIGAILGLSKYQSALDVWMEKTGKEIKSLDSLPLRFGSFAEEFVASEYARHTGLELIHDKSIYLHSQYTFMSAHIDRFVHGDGIAMAPTKILECKTANPFAQSDWGDVGSDQVPMSYLCQCAWYQAITGIDEADLAVLFGNSDFRIYQIQRDKELEELLLDKATTFWDEYVLKDIPPPPQSEADYQALFKRGNAEQSIEANLETVKQIARLHLLNAEISTKEDEISVIKQHVMGQLENAELLTYQNQILATWKAPKPSFRLDTKRLEQDHPALCTNYKSPVQNSRRLLIKELKTN